mgnify:CR=1 FL=1
MNKIIEKAVKIIDPHFRKGCDCISCEESIGMVKDILIVIRDAPDDSEVYNNYRCDKLWKNLYSKEVWQLWIDAILKE